MALSFSLWRSLVLTYQAEVFWGGQTSSNHIARIKAGWGYWLLGQWHDATDANQRDPLCVATSSWSTTDGGFTGAERMECKQGRCDKNKQKQTKEKKNECKAFFLSLWCDVSSFCRVPDLSSAQTLTRWNLRTLFHFPGVGLIKFDLIWSQVFVLICAARWFGNIYRIKDIRIIHRHAFSEMKGSCGTHLSWNK